MNIKRKRRILAFSSAYLPFLGGAEIALKEISDRLSGRFEFDLITTRLNSGLPSFERIGNINIYRIGKVSLINILLPKVFFPIFAYFKAKKISKKNNPYDLVFALQASAGAGGAYLYKIFNPGIPLLLNIQEGKDMKQQSRLVNFFRNRIIEGSDYITTISNYLREVVLKSGADERKVSIVPNGVDVEKFSKEIAYGKLSELKDQLGIRPDDKVVISVSRLTKKNGVDTIIKAMPFLGEGHKLILVGEGEEKSALAVLIMELNVSDRVIFAGNVDNDELPKYLKISNVFVRPSRSEGMGISFLEAMAAGVPVVATPVGGITDFVSSAETGVFCAVDNEESVAEKIKLLIENKELKEKITQNAFKMVKEKYNWNKIAKNYNDLFSELTS